jgi:oligopeptide transport system permease protein
MKPEDRMMIGRMMTGRMMNAGAEDRWALVNPGLDEAETLKAKSYNYLEETLYQFTRRKTAVAGLVAALFLALSALLGPLFSGKSYEFQDLSHVNTPPLLRVSEIKGKYYYITSNMKLTEVSAEGVLTETLQRVLDDGERKRFGFDINGETYFLNYRHDPPWLEDPREQRILQSKTLRNKIYPLGSDGLGRDIFIRLLYGMRISLTVALIATAVNLLIGVFYGSIAGYIGGTVDIIMMRMVDMLSSIPLTLYVILIMILFNNGGFISIVIALGLVYWVDMARVVRGQILSLKEQDFVIAARTMGSGNWYILRKHLIVNAIGPITVTATMQIPAAIFTEAFMSFIGLGITAPAASLGTMCNDALEGLRTTPYQLAFPALTICVIMFAFNFIGDGLRDAFDPHMRR